MQGRQRLVQLMKRTHRSQNFFPPSPPDAPSLSHLEKSRYDLCERSSSGAWMTPSSKMTRLWPLRDPYLSAIFMIRATSEGVPIHQAAEKQRTTSDILPHLPTRIAFIFLLILRILSNVKFGTPEAMERSALGSLHVARSSYVGQQPPVKKLARAGPCPTREQSSSAQ